MRVALFGASSLGREWAQRLSGHRRYIVDAFIDNDRTKWDTLVDGIRVRKPDTGVFGEADLVVVTSIHGAAIVAQVTGAGFGAKLVIDPAALLPPVS